MCDLKCPTSSLHREMDYFAKYFSTTILRPDNNYFFQFVEENFDEEGNELEPWEPEDWTPEPEFIAKLRKPALRNLAKRIARLWRDLSRRIKDDVKDNPNLYSIIYVPNGFIVPGGELTEFFKKS